MISASMMDKMDDWHSEGLPLKGLTESSLEAGVPLENMDMAIQVILEMVPKGWSFCKTALGFIGSGCSVNLCKSKMAVADSNLASPKQYGKQVNAL